MALGAPESEVRLTVVVSPREGHFAAVAALERVLADDSLPFDLIYADVLAPPDTAARIATLCAARGFTVLRFDDWIAPAMARKAALARVATPYVLFIDNDVMPEPGCLATLVACAEETGAGLVGPLYLQGPADNRLVHMAGGLLLRNEGGDLTAEKHILPMAPIEAAAGLRRRRVDFVETHCTLARTDVVRRPGVISEQVLLAAEHIDLGLAVQAQGVEVWTEPAARVQLSILNPPHLGDLDFFRSRWDVDQCDRDLEAFRRRWPVADPTEFFGLLRGFHVARLSESNPVHPGACFRDRDRPMAPSELCQTRTSLRELAAARGYEPANLRAIEAACDYATLLCDGVYRADGRPFLNHLIGTAGVLIRYDFRVDVVLAGLLHAAYSHRPPWEDPAEVSRILASGGGVDAIVKAIPGAKTHLATGATIETLPLVAAWPLVVEAANEAEMLLSGEYRATGRPPEISETGLDLLTGVLGRLGAAGLAVAIRTPRGDARQGPILGRGPPYFSFRLDARNRRFLPPLAES